MYTVNGVYDSVCQMEFIKIKDVTNTQQSIKIPLSESEDLWSLIIIIIIHCKCIVKYNGSQNVN